MTNIPSSKIVAKTAPAISILVGFIIYITGYNHIVGFIFMLLGILAYIIIPFAPYLEGIINAAKK